MWATIGIAVIFTLGCVFFYLVGMANGVSKGAVFATTYYRQRGALKDKSNIIGFSNWPEAMRQLFEADTQAKTEDQ